MATIQEIDYDPFASAKTPKSGNSSVVEVDYNPFQEKAKEPSWYDKAKSIASETARQVGLTARAGIGGIASTLDIPNTLVAAGTQAVNALTGAHIPVVNPSPFRNLSESGLSKVGVPEPKDATERIVQAGVSGMSGAGSMAKLSGLIAQTAASPVTREVLKQMASHPGAQVLSGASSSAASEAAKESGGGQGTQLAAGLLGAFAPVAAPSVAKGAVKSLGKLAQESVGLATGAGGENLKIAYQSGKEGNPVFVSNMRGEVPVEQVLQESKDGLQKMQQRMFENYKNAKTGWAADKTKLDFKKIDEEFNRLEKTLQENGHDLIGKSERAKVDEVKDVLKEWRDDPNAHTTLGLDALKRRLDAIYPENYSQKQAQRVITGTRNAVKDTIVKQAPDYASAMSDYETRIETIRDIEKALSLGDRTSKDTAVRKLQSLTRNNAATNYGYRDSLASQLEKEGEVSLRPALAGQALNTMAPRGLARIPATAAGISSVTNPLLAATLPATSPRLMGELFYGAGRAAGQMGKLKDFITGTTAKNAAAQAAAEKAAADEAQRLSMRVLAPGEESAYPIPQKQIGPAPQPRPTLQLQDELPYKTPDTDRLATRHDVPTIEFPLRQEVLQYPEHKQAIENYVRRSEAIKAKMSKAIDPDVQARYQKELDSVSTRFADYMKQFGIDTAEDATGLRRPLYEKGKGTKLPIKKTFDPREKKPLSELIKNTKGDE